MKTFSEFKDFLKKCSDDVVLVNHGHFYSFTRARLGDILFLVNSGYSVDAVNAKLDELATSLALGELTINSN